jgi:uncharacterized membrane protein YeaQ/YmgE (transglycosylase-associated protein family)
VIGFLVAGLVIGALARLIVPGRQNLGILATLLLGVVGSVIGGVIANLLGTGSIWELNVLGFVVAVIASVLLVGVAEAIAGNRRRAIRYVPRWPSTARRSPPGPAGCRAWACRVRARPGARPRRPGRCR